MECTIVRAIEAVLLREVAEAQGARAWMIDGPDDIRREWFDGAEVIGLTAGASAPEVLVQRVVARLREWGVTAVNEQNGVLESVEFPVPRELR